ncbi:hypothetical protein [Alteromonas gilva]|uniref:Porin n=1 Tax=Alteromonas gilva TaxID=2987522 RepID=A0ABT5L0H5_9ALTE|nr:hypothetical protein [Alteromonas gilva]MDC8829926.1 hypothetical protein [Alteromonas gilva]
MFLFWNNARRVIMLVYLTGLSMITPIATADIEVSGFATAGFTTSNDDELIFQSSLDRIPEAGINWQTNSLLGVQINYQVSDELDIVVQALLEHKHNNSIADFLEMAFVRYRFNRNWSARLGRLNYNAYLTSEYLNVGYSTLWASPPTEFYTPSSNISYIDGAELEYRKSVSTGIMQATFAYGDSQANIASTGDDYWLKYKRVVNGSLSFETSSWGIKATLSHFHGEDSYFGSLNDFQRRLPSIPESWWPTAGNFARAIDFKGKQITYAALGYHYNNGTWLLMSEVAMLDIDWALLNNLAYGYTTFGYIYGDVTPYITLAKLNTTDKRTVLAEPDYEGVPTRDGRQALSRMHRGSQNLLDISRMQQQSVTAGARWDIDERWALKGQVARYQISGPGYGIWGSDLEVSVGNKRYITVASINLSTIF